MSRRFRALAPEHLKDLSGHCDGCVFWESASEQPRQCGVPCDADEWAAWWRRVGDEWGDPGRAALDEDEVLGFVKYAPARYFPQSRTFTATPDDEDTVLIACLHVEPDARHRGLGKVLLQAALRDLMLRGVRRVEAYGSVVRSDPIEDMPMLNIEFLLREGFTVAKPDTAYPLLRLDLRSLAAITENLEVVFEGLKFPLRTPQRVPTPWMRSR